MQDKQSEKDFFNKFASQHDYDVLDTNGYNRLLREFTLLMQPVNGQTLLEIGSGTGAFTEYLKELGLQVVGLDISMECILRAVSSLPGALFATGDTEFLPFADNTFDMVTYSGILHHLPSLSKAFSEGFRILKPGGKVFAYDPNGNNPAMWLYRSVNSPLSSRQGVTVNERLLVARETKTSMHRVGFVNAKAYGISGISFTYVENPIIRRLLPIYNFADTCLNITGLSRLLGTFLISCASKPI